MSTTPFPVISNIEPEWYGFKLFGTPGEIVTDLDHIDQAIKVILTTPQRSVPHHPTWFSNLNEAVDRPVTEVRDLITEGVRRSLELHEPRIDVIGIEVTPFSDVELEKLRVTIRWRVREIGDEGVTEIVL